MAENQYEVIAVSYPLSVQTQSVGPIGGVAVDHPLQATLYAYKKGKMKVLVPFEIMIIPMGTGSLEPERQTTKGFPISGQVRPQQNVNYPVYNRNSHHQNPVAQFGPNYYPPHSYQPYPHTPYNSYAPYNTYNPYNQRPIYRNPYYTPAATPPLRRVDISHTRPWPQFRPSQQVGK